MQELTADNIPRFPTLVGHGLKRSTWRMNCPLELAGSMPFRWEDRYDLESDLRYVCVLVTRYVWACPKEKRSWDLQSQWHYAVTALSSASLQTCIVHSSVHSTTLGGVRSLQGLGKRQLWRSVLGKVWHGSFHHFWSVADTALISCPCFFASLTPRTHSILFDDVGASYS